MTETEAIAQLRQGNIGGLELLVQQYYQRAVQTAYLIVRDHAGIQLPSYSRAAYTPLNYWWRWPW